MMLLPDCPLCKSPNAVRKAHKRSLDPILRLFGLFAYRCDGCTTRFYRFLRPGTGLSGAQ